MSDTRMVIVPNELRDEINAKLDYALRDCPDAAVDRSELFNQVLFYYDMHGTIPEFSISKENA